MIDIHSHIVLLMDDDQRRLRDKASSSSRKVTVRGSRFDISSSKRDVWKPQKKRSYQTTMVKEMQETHLARMTCISKQKLPYARYLRKAAVIHSNAGWWPACLTPSMAWRSQGDSPQALGVKLLRLGDLVVAYIERYHCLEKNENGHGN